MGTDSVTNISATDATNLQNDVTELKNKLNLAVSDITELRTKLISNTSLINILRTDLIEIQDALHKDGSGTYTGPTSPSDKGILVKIKNIENAISDYLLYGLTYDSSTLVTKLSLNPQSASVSVDPKAKTLSTTAETTSAVTDPATQGSSSATVTGSYTTETQDNVVTVGITGANRARKLARQTLNRLRK